MRLVYTLPFLLALFFQLSFSAPVLDAILSDIEEESDLSKSTKLESVGHLYVFTRQKLDVLHIDTIKDLMEYVNFVGYGENNKGLPDLSFIPDVAKDVAYMKVFIDDQPLFSPFFGNGIQFFGKADLNFVDHIEVYWGAPSFTFGLDTAYMVIKLYTKNPTRENITSINAYGGSYGTFGVSGFSSKDYGDFSYLLSISRKNLNQKKMYKYDGFALKRDQTSTFLYTKFYFNNSSVSLNALDSKYDIFIGDSVTYKPTKNQERHKSFYLSYDYLSDDKTLKAHVSFSKGKTKTQEQADPLALYAFKDDVFKVFSQDFTVDETFIDAYISKTFTFGKHSLDIGIKNRYQTMEQPKMRINGQKEQLHYDYTHQFATSVYFEDKYLINDENLVLASGTYSRRHKKVKELSQNDYAFRVGYIHNEKRWYVKLFGYYSKNSSLIHNFFNYSNFYGYTPIRQTIKSYSGEVGLNIPKSTLSLAYARLHISPPKPSDTIHSNLVSFNFDHRFNSFHHAKSSLWYFNFDLGNNGLNTAGLIKGKYKRQGAHIIFFDRFGDFEFANSVIFLKNSVPNEKVYTVNSAINYHVNKNLKLYLKLNNIFNNSPNKSYLGGVYENGKYSIYPAQFPLFDRTIYLGGEYSF